VQQLAIQKNVERQYAHWVNTTRALSLTDFDFDNQAASLMNVF